MTPNNESTINRIEELLLLAEDGRLEADGALAMLNALDALKQRVRDLDQAVKTTCVDFIESHGDLVSGDLRYYVGPKKTTRIIDTRAALESLLEACGGDLDGVVEALTSQPFRIGQVKRRLGPDCSLIDTVIETELKTGKPVRTLKKANDRFMPQNKGDGK